MDNTDLSEYSAPNRYLTAREVSVALRSANGSVTKAADALNVTPYRLSRFIASRPKFQEMQKGYRSALVDLAESHLMDAIQMGERWAVQMVLKTLGKSKGYTEKSEIKHTHEMVTDPSKMIDSQLEELVAQRAKEKRISQRNQVIEIKPNEISNDSILSHEEVERTNVNGS
jgi:hypothetical protein